MGQAIICRFHGATNSKPPRVTARAWGGSVTVPYHLKGRDADAPYWDAAEALCDKLVWGKDGMACGTLPDGKTRVFVFAPIGRKR